MTTIQTLPKLDSPSLDGDDKPLLHFFCGECYPVLRAGDIALCGYVCEGQLEISDADAATWPLCIVCEGLELTGCVRCGAGS